MTAFFVFLYFVSNTMIKNIVGMKAGGGYSQQD